MTTARRGVILPVVLLMLLLLGLMVAGFAFRINADLATTRAMEYRLQTRLAAEAGIEKVKLMLALDRNDTDLWWDNPEELNRIIVWSAGGDETIWGVNEDLDEGTMAYRFSIVADDPTEDEDYCRFGIIDESSKINLNVATKEQLRMLVTAAVGEDEEINPYEIVDAILDWRDPDSDPRTEEGDTEGEYYRSLDRPYKVKNGPFDSVEELLLVKGMTGRILYGEDYDRNGLLTPNEDDGDETFPLDNEDNELNLGMYPYLTVLAYESNVSNDNRPRIYLLGEETLVREQLAEVFPEDEAFIDYIISAARGSSGGAGGGAGPPGGGGPGGGGGGQVGGGPDRRGPGGPRGGDEGGPGDARESPGGRGPRGPGDERGDTGRGGKGPRPIQPPAGGNAGTPDGPRGPKSGGRQQYREEGEGEEEEQPLDPLVGGEELEKHPPDDLLAGEEGDESEPEEGLETDYVGGGAQPIRSPVELLVEPLTGSKHAEASLLWLEHLPVLLDRTTLVPPEQQKIVGLININTAPRMVLRSLEDLTEEQVESILETRSLVDAEAKLTTAWLVTEEVLDQDTYVRIAGAITARGEQFTIESLGFADHVGMITRLQVVVDMTGPIAQTILYRDLSKIGGHFPIREEDEEKIRGH